LHLAVAHEYLRFDDLFLLVEILAVIVPLLWQYKGLWDEVEVLSRKSLLHPAHVFSEPVLPSQLQTRWEVVNLLMLVQTFVEVALTLGVRPKHVPIVAIG